MRIKFHIQHETDIFDKEVDVIHREMFLARAVCRIFPQRKYEKKNTDVVRVWISVTVCSIQHRMCNLSVHCSVQHSAHTRLEGAADEDDSSGAAEDQ